MSNAIIIEHLQDTTVVRFNRPAERNPLSIAVLESLHGIVDRTGAVLIQPLTPL